MTASAEPPRPYVCTLRPGDGKTKGRLLAEKLVELGLAGNVMAITAIADRVDGKPAQSITHRGDTEAPLHVNHSGRRAAPTASD